MFSLRTWRLGFKSLILHPLRSLLTVLGIFIGVASVIWLLAIGEGISLKAQEQIEGLGADNILVVSVKPAEESTANQGGPVEYGLLRTDFDRLVTTIPNIKDALPMRILRRQFRFDQNKVDGRMVGCTPGYAGVTRLEIDRGRFLTDADIREKKNHCVLSYDMAERLFTYKNPIGRTIHVDDDTDYYVVVGVVRDREASAAIGGSLKAQDYSKDIYIPISTLRGRIGDFVISRRSGGMEGEILELNQITLRVDGMQNVTPTAAIVRNSLTEHEERGDVSVIVPRELLEQARTTRAMFMLFMGLIAAISLLVGGIGIMNIMLATVTERTREIGIRRALGAKQRDILQQFLIEAIVLSIVGGLSGVVGGLVLIPLTDQARKLFFRYSPELMMNLPDVIRTVRPVIVEWSIPLAFGIAVGIGILFGVYPASRAAKLDPIEALRHE